MKLWLSAVVAVLISSQSFAAAGDVKPHDVTVPAPVTGKPVAEQEPAHVRLNRFVNACLLQQGVNANPQAEQVARSIGTDVR